jgi:hypothetical protein
MGAGRAVSSVRGAIPVVVASLVMSLFAAVPAFAASCSSKGACKLVFTTPPKDAKVGDPVTGAPFDPSITAPAVAVTVEYTSTNLPATTYSDPIVITLIPSNTNTATGTLSGTTSVVPTNGVATFGGISIDAFGSYKLEATSGTRVTLGDSDPFTIWTYTKKCTPGEECGTVLDATDESVNLSDSSLSGTLAFSVGAENTANPCVASLKGKLSKAQFGPNVTQIGGITLSGGRKLVTLTYSKAYVMRQSDNGASFYQVCYQSDTPFTPLGGGDQVTTGLLPPCDAQVSFVPCIASKSKNSGSGTVIIQLVLPGSDPKFW